MASTSKMDLSDYHWDQMVSKAVAYQQDFYELLPSWTIYKKEDVKFIKQNIGYSIFGSPLFERTSDSKDILNFKVNNTNEDTEICDVICYSPNAQDLIDRIFNMIWTYGRRLKDDNINYGIVYNILFRNKMDKPSTSNDEEEIIAIPVFKIQHYNDKTQMKSNTHNENIYTVWYIDIKGRVYKSWEDYLKNNNLPKCTMVFPKDGYYQPNPEFEITPNKSIIWLIVQDSYACSKRANILSIINNTINAVGTAAIVGFGIATIFNPTSSIVAIGKVATLVASGAWTFKTSSVKLYDMAVHQESIKPFNRNALSAWLGIAGSTVGIAICGSTILLKKAVAAGVTVNQLAMSTHDAMVITSISINLIGLGYESLHILGKYKQEKRVDIQDIIYLGTYLLFFTNSIINITFAKEIIELTQGDILRKIETELRDNNLHQYYEFKKMKSSIEPNGNKMNQNAAIIRQLKTVTVNDFTSNNNYFVYTSNRLLSIEQGKIKLNGITLLDPLLFVAMIGKNLLKNINNCEDQSNTYIDQQNTLKKLLETLLTDLYLSRNDLNTECVPTIPQFRFLIEELKKIDNSENILSFIFNTAVTILNSGNKLAYLVEGCRFVWDYIKTNLIEAGFEKFLTAEYSSSYNNNNVMELFFITIFNAVDSMIQAYFNALQEYIRIIHKSY
ncbi:uncharacterized protein LOC124956212 isoform X1 [Vespa velutina]|uniref:uncharacterized protein LOC124956212 isoform X1 n=2 Tax=Vespa velutina TaxID=202808 RepID=UPI001FB3D75C|nr:uncharacterized protein LOC124956212 isoform X1 [Vespa velutina]